MVDQGGNHLVRDCHNLLALPLGESLNEVCDQKSNVFGSLS